MSNVYLKVEYSTGLLYEYSKEKVEGFEEHTSDKGKTTYRKYYKRGAFGTLRGVTIREVEFNGTKTKEVSVAMRDKDQNNIYINVPLFDAKKNITDYAEGVISHLKSIKQGEAYRVFPYNIKNDGDKYSNVGMSFKKADLEKEEAEKDPLPKLTKSFAKKDGTITEGDIPAIVFEKDFDGGWVKDAKARNKFLYETLVAFVEGTPVDNTPAPSTAPKAEAKPAIQPDKSFEKTKVVEDNSDLPFG